MTVTASYIAVKMMPECAFTVCTDCGVRIIPLIVGGILKTSHVLTIFSNYSIHCIILTHLSPCYFFLLLGINLWKGMLKKQPSSPALFFFYILYIDLILIAMHNI